MGCDPLLQLPAATGGAPALPPWVVFWERSLWGVLPMPREHSQVLLVGRGGVMAKVELLFQAGAAGAGGGSGFLVLPSLDFRSSRNQMSFFQTLFSLANSHWAKHACGHSGHSCSRRMFLSFCWAISVARSPLTFRFISWSCSQGWVNWQIPVYGPQRSFCMN